MKSGLVLRGASWGPAEQRRARHCRRAISGQEGDCHTLTDHHLKFHDLYMQKTEVLAVCRFTLLRMPFKSRATAILVAAGVVAGSIAALSSPSSAAAPGTVVISQVYGGGGNSGAPLTN